MRAGAGSDSHVCLHTAPEGIKSHARRGLEFPEAGLLTRVGPGQDLPLACGPMPCLVRTRWTLRTLLALSLSLSLLRRFPPPTH